MIITYKCKCGEYKVEENKEEFYKNTIRLVLCPDCREEAVVLDLKGDK